ncbi:MAG: prepilin peptidase [Kurthia sp.]|nr:prepilin peptidase [Candidatus Kurthia equi]
MVIYYSCVIFLFGAAFGSFYNVVGLRLPKGKSIVSPPSQCENCHYQLKPLDLIPILSFIFLKGKCRKCGVKIGAFHTLIELFTALLAVAAYLKFGFSVEVFVAWLMISLFAIITVSDLLYQIIQDKILLFFGIPILILRFFSPLDPWWDMFAGAFFGFGIFLLLSILSHGGMGGGDIKLYFVIGLVLGIKLTFVSIFLSAVIGLIAAIILKRGFGKTIPFGPSIAIGSLLAYFYGNNLVDWYMNLLM